MRIFSGNSGSYILGGCVVAGLVAGCAAFDHGRRPSAIPSTVGSPATVGLVGGDLSIYRAGDNEVGHDRVKTAQFLVPVGGRVAVSGLEFANGSAALTPRHQEILVQVFNSVEEITENTVGDTNRMRVAEFKAMRFEVCGFADDTASISKNLNLARDRAQAVVHHLVNLGTPAWRFQIQTFAGVSRGTDKPAVVGRSDSRRVEFVRIQ